MGRVMKRVEKIGKYCTYSDKEVIAGMKRVFAPRCATLRSLEGWYKFTQINDHGTTFEGSFKFSCNYNDILRAADSKHFEYSCFRPQGAHKLQPLKRLLNPDWAVIFMPDKSGIVQARAWVQANTKPVLKLPYTENEINEPFNYGTLLACDCITCRNQARDNEDWRRQRHAERLEIRRKANQEAQEAYDEAVRIRAQSPVPYLNISHVQGSNLHLDTIKTTLDSVATLEVVSDIYL